MNTATRSSPAFAVPRFGTDHRWPSTQRAGQRSSGGCVRADASRGLVAPSATRGPAWTVRRDDAAPCLPLSDSVGRSSPVLLGGQSCRASQRVAIFPKRDQLRVLPCRHLGRWPASISAWATRRPHPHLSQTDVTENRSDRLAIRSAPPDHPTVVLGRFRSILDTRQRWAGSAEQTRVATSSHVEDAANPRAPRMEACGVAAKLAPRPT